MSDETIISPHGEVFRLIAEKSSEYSKLDPELEKVLSSTMILLTRY